MAEYIERDAAIKAVLGITICIAAEHQYADAVLFNLNKLQAADVAPVRRGYWIEREDMYYGWNIWECSDCREEFCVEEGTPKDNKYDYCPACGAKMEEAPK